MSVIRERVVARLLAAGWLLAGCCFHLTPSGTTERVLARRSQSDQLIRVEYLVLCCCDSTPETLQPATEKNLWLTGWRNKQFSSRHRAARNSGRQGIAAAATCAAVCIEETVVKEGQKQLFGFDSNGNQPFTLPPDPLPLLLEIAKFPLCVCGKC